LRSRQHRLDIRRIRTIPAADPMISQQPYVAGFVAEVNNGGDMVGATPRMIDPNVAFTAVRASRGKDRAAAGYSPDRVDALVWAFSELLVKPMNCEGIYKLYRRRDAEAAAQRSKPQATQTLPQPGSMEWFEAQRRRAEPIRWYRLCRTRSWLTSKAC
jgi:hypothetical protein